MSVKITIEHPSGAFRRILEVSRVSEKPNFNRLNREADDVDEYYVKVLNSPEGQPRETATFPHRYGDDLITLTMEALEALGGKNAPRHETLGFQQR